MVTLELDSVSYGFKIRSDTSIESVFTSGRYMNMGQKISIQLYRPLTWTEDWHRVLEKFVGKQVTLTIGEKNIVGVVSSDSSADLDVFECVLYVVAHDTKGLIK